MSDPIDRQALIKSFEEELAEAKDFRDYFVKLPNTVFEQSLCNEAVKAWKLGIGIARNMPTVDAVPRQKYEEDMDAFAHGYTDAESNFRKMIADGELVKVVRCESCKHWKNEHICESLSRYGTFETPKNFYCGYGKAK